ncbi:MULTISPECIES: hypothetical protein [Prochlorococcus]|uniref:Uncharacterized protein n=1 Tax=Prochlorococcus marinus (strain SARG / CCMP1375 / SS120) TaxID=167539 RepID=Q7VE66_PROMA|nr:MULTISPECIES: hypothetical protein [Prochlorococcus]AAP99193.1 Predicted protein [Prochlorococcus marinus subsp. marinus str. CCMP1375]KGG11539.1 hypothetical protein EV04_1064 [Prochlorococcus marinus str. LG]KGG18507.1 hypothetical protein EV08_1754 [Prochlorococcus marinus str. SS2]KGG22780.1 hypothetical protein EV09_1521 [Prochlorococcus marinus str. SS35]KGG32657.1 hypothetical protein EV10_0974 [Prochlorococcus marinus str. SS51]
MASKRDKINNYFFRDYWLYLVIFIALLGLVSIVTVIGPIIFWGLAYWVYKKKLSYTGGAMTDAQIEDEYRIFAESQYKVAREACGIDENMLVQSPDWFWFVWDIEGNNKKYRKGKDKIFRADTRGICILNYGKDQIFSYHTAKNIRTGLEGVNDMSEYFYNDVAGFEVTQNKVMTLKTTAGDVHYYLKGGGYGGDTDTDTNTNAFSALMNTLVKESGDHSRAKTVINVTRAMLRERKSIK